ncbi:MAG: hypothetical protein WC816_08165 [Sphingomonas sp.]|jgi:Ca2+-binding RTX toxin-like protein
MNSDLFLSILALDSYNRGYQPGISELSSEPGTSLGSAIIFRDSSILIQNGERRDEPAGFYAISYILPNFETVISYRGTDNYIPYAPGNDILNGWTTSAGFADQSEAKLAIDFYHAVTGRDAYSSAEPPSVVLTGHSLGGALAGLVGALSGAQAVGFDHAPFGVAAFAQAQAEADRRSTVAGTDPASVGIRIPDVSRLTGYYVDGEVNELLRNGALQYTLAGLTGLVSPELLAAIEFFGLDNTSGTVAYESLLHPQKLDVFDSDFAGLDALARHSQSLLVTLLYGQKVWNAPASEPGGLGKSNDWQAAAKYVLPSLFDADVASALGRTQSADGVGGTGFADVGSQLSTVIAYSAISEGEKPFGDAGIQSLFDDTDDLGKVITGQAESSFLISELFDDQSRKDISSIIVEHAGLLALNKSLQSNDSTFADGILNYDSTNGTLSIDLSDDKWQLDSSSETVSITKKDDLIDHLIGSVENDSTIIADAASWYAGKSGENLSGLSDAVDTIAFDTEGTVRSVVPKYVSTSGLNAVVSLSNGDGEAVKPGTTNDFLLIGSSQGENLFGADGRDIIFSGDGDDILVGGAGDDWLDGGNGDDIADYSNQSSPVVIRFVGPSGYNGGETPNLTVDDGTGGTDTLHSIETIKGTSGEDRLAIVGGIPQGYSLTIDANGGQTGGFRDIVDANGSTDIAGLVIINSADGTGYIRGRTAQNGIIHLLGFHTNIIGSKGDDIISDDSTGDKDIDGGEGDDNITIGGGRSIIKGGEGNDTLSGGSASDLLLGGDGTNVLDGGDGADFLISSGGEDTLRGGAGSDYLLAKGSFATLDGGAGNDVIDARTSFSTTVLFGEGSGHDTVLINTDPDAYSGVSAINLSSLSKDDVSIIFDASVISAYYGIEAGLFYVLSGDLVIKINATGETLYFPNVGASAQGDESREISGIYTSTPIYIDIPELDFSDGSYYGEFHFDDFDVQFGAVSSYNQAEADYASGVLSATGTTTGTSGSDNLKGGFGDDTISAGNGDDIIVASGGNDTIDGGTGADELDIFGSLGDFTRELISGSLVLTDNTGAEGKVTLTNVESIFSATDGASYSVGDLLSAFGTSGNDSVLGTPFADTLTGGDGDDTIFGKGGDDTIDGGSGIDQALYAGSSSDFIISRELDGSISVYDPVGDEGYDVLTNVESLHFSGDNTTIAVDDLPALGTSGADAITGTSRGESLYGQEGADTINSAGGNDFIDGGSGDDLLNGGNGNDYLLGGAGDDSLTGGAGDDILEGDDGADTAIYAGVQSDYQLATVDGFLTVTDLAPGVDGDDGTDQLTGIETLAFKDGSISIGAPIVLDLDGNGVALTSIGAAARFDLNGDGIRDASSWISSGDAFLFLDRNHDGSVSGVEELSFVGDKAGATSDLDGLGAFDTNADGQLSADDAAFQDFGLWRDADGNGQVGIGEILTLASAGIEAINLSRSPTNSAWAWGSGVVLNNGNFTYADGSTGSLADVALAYRPGTIGGASSITSAPIDIAPDIRDELPRNFPIETADGVEQPAKPTDDVGAELRTATTALRPLSLDDVEHGWWDRRTLTFANLQRSVRGDNHAAPFANNSVLQAARFAESMASFAPATGTYDDHIMASIDSGELRIAPQWYVGETRAFANI